MPEFGSLGRVLVPVLLPTPMPTDPNYIGANLPLYESPADDVDCGEIEERNFFPSGQIRIV